MISIGVFSGNDLQQLLAGLHRLTDACDGQRVHRGRKPAYRSVMEATV